MNASSGDKKITIREGHRDYTEGSILIGCDILNWACMANITSVKHCLLHEVTDNELKDDGFYDLEDAAKGLSEYYPNINIYSPVTVIRWELIKR